MDGKELLRRHKQLLHIKSTDTDWDEMTAYDYLYEAAKQWVIETECLTDTQTITTAGTTATYTIDGKYLSLYLKHNDRYFIKYNDGTTDYFLYFKPYEEVIFENNTANVTIPGYFTITDDPTIDTLVSDTADNAADDVGGKTVLTMDTEVFADITPGDIIYNTTDVSEGIVTKVTSTKIIEICLFGGTDNEIDVSDAFFIQPRKRFLLQLDPPPSTTSHTVTLYFVKKPDPVYSDYGVYEIPYEYSDTLCKYAAWLYKYRDQEPQFGDAFFKYWDMQIKNYRRLTRKGLARGSRIIPQWSR